MANKLIGIHQQLENLSEVRGKKLFGALSQVDTISISKVGEKVTVLNEEISQAAATFGKGLIHKHHEVSQKELDAAVAVSRETVGEKMTNILITQSQKPEPAKISRSLVQVVLQIIMVKFCASKIQSWYPDDSFIGELLSMFYSDIHSTRKRRIDL